MKNEPKTKDEPALILEKTKEDLPEEIVLSDECGDSLWDKVLEQEERKSLLENH